jgi:hypothetical protein
MHTAVGKILLATLLLNALADVSSFTILPYPQAGVDAANICISRLMCRQGRSDSPRRSLLSHTKVRATASFEATADSSFAAQNIAVPTGLSDVSRWHRNRRKAILAAHPEVAQLEKPDWKGVLLLLTCNAVLYACAAAASSMHWLAVVARNPPKFYPPLSLLYNVLYT